MRIPRATVVLLDTRLFSHKMTGMLRKPEAIHSSKSPWYCFRPF